MAIAAPDPLPGVGDIVYVPMFRKVSGEARALRGCVARSSEERSAPHDASPRGLLRRLLPEPEALLAGTVSGVVGTLIGYPADFLKSRRQACPDELGVPLTKSFRRVVRREGFFALWKGVASPLAMHVCVNSVSFGLQDTFKKRFAAAEGTSPGDMSRWRYFASGACVALFITPITTPFELVKIKMTLDNTRPGGSLYTSSLQCATRLARKYGIRSLFNGYMVNGVREIIFVSVYFGMYESGRQYTHGNKWMIPVLGGSAGATAWTCSFALDAIKTRVQGGPMRERGTLRRCIAIAGEIITKQGFRGLFAGLGASIGRAFIVSSTRFTAFELARSIIHRVSGDEQQAVVQLSSPSSSSAASSSSSTTPAVAHATRQSS